jgi:hypothetical protein
MIGGSNWQHIGDLPPAVERSRLLVALETRYRRYLEFKFSKRGVYARTRVDALLSRPERWFGLASTFVQGWNLVAKV